MISFICNIYSYNKNTSSQICAVSFHALRVRVKSTPKAFLAQYAENIALTVTRIALVSELQVMRNVQQHSIQTRLSGATRHHNK